MKIKLSKLIIPKDIEPANRILSKKAQILNQDLSLNYELSSLLQKLIAVKDPLVLTHNADTDEPAALSFSIGYAQCDVASVFGITDKLR